MPLLDLRPRGKVGRYLPILGPFLAPTPARAASDGKCAALTPFHVCRAAKEPWKIPKEIPGVSRREPKARN